MTTRCKSWGDLVAGTQANRKAKPREGELKEAASEPTGRRTETGYEAVPIGASVHLTAKLLRPRVGTVDPAIVWGRPSPLPGEISPRAEKPRRRRRSEKSAEVVVVAERDEGPNGQEGVRP